MSSMVRYSLFSSRIYAALGLTLAGFAALPATAQNFSGSDNLVARQPAAIDAAVAQFTGAGTGSPGGARTAADPRLARVIRLTEELIDTPRHLSQHVGGFVMTQSRLDEVVPIENAAQAAGLPPF